MERTGEGQIPRLVLANAQHVRGLPGEKTDPKDGKRLAGTDASRTNPAELRSTAGNFGASGFDPVSEQAVVGRQANGIEFRKYWRMRISNWVRSYRTYLACLDKRCYRRW